ncbi:ATP-dependent helicase [Kribbella sandramycini]|uniref:ATP-dependent helicase n=1 Tax=Kribbella sandramycini TaxID=60450 RepID=A0A7Y4KXN4_9ACTN|nr:UvrD-helicase domain-containing protein [Kribbella sandramycini]MBB6569626.1 DNA helicase-2/ATP-dependent DNA helicase PcrA [Kribbella sandramycini]NOL40539.1 ATP-dependent helicase [Kribbella sandramycini]
MSRRLLNPDTDADRAVRDIIGDPQISGFTMIAGAGSGKTTSLVKALDAAITARGADFLATCRQVACVTYTEIATQEIEADLALNPVAHVSTIHSFLWSLIAPFQNDIRTWAASYGPRRLRELRDELAGLGPGTGTKRRRELMGKIRRLEHGVDKLDGVTRFRYGVGRNYADGVVGHDDILKMVPELIQTKPLLSRIVARRFPLVFVDESQDTFPEVVKCLRHIAVQERERFCLGFFGDPMQRIYLQGAGDIRLEADWHQVEKPENFRSPRRVLDVINTIRAGGDDLVQRTGLSADRQRDGEVTFFVFPADDQRIERLNRARAWLAARSTTGAWQDDRTKILVTTHRMAARRLAFGNLYTVFHSSRLSDDFDEGRAWPLTPFLGVLLPLATAAIDNRPALVPILRKSSPLLRPETLGQASVGDTLTGLATGIEELASLLTTGGPGTIGQALRISRDRGLIEIDDRLAPYLDADTPTEDLDELGATLTAYLDCDVAELAGYAKYVGQLSAYSTQQGVKGTEFPDVLVVLDDQESTHNQFSYDKLFGIRPPSPTDIKRRRGGEETTIDRTRRLFYVCASRATESLAIVLYAADVSQATAALRHSHLLDDNQVVGAHTVDTWAETP